MRTTRYGTYLEYELGTLYDSVPDIFEYLPTVLYLEIENSKEDGKRRKQLGL